MKYLLLAIAFFIAGHVNASESTRQAKISKIMEAQGLQPMIQQQLDESKAQASEIGKGLYQKMLAESGVVDGQLSQKLEGIFSQYVERFSTMFSAKEFIEIWSRFYGTNLSESDLDKILAYYKSPVGKKDVAASQAAMNGFSEVMSAQSKKRLNDAIELLMADLKAAMEATKPAVDKDAPR